MPTQPHHQIITFTTISRPQTGRKGKDGSVPLHLCLTEHGARLHHGRGASAGRDQCVTPHQCVPVPRRWPFQTLDSLAPTKSSYWGSPDEIQNLRQIKLHTHTHTHTDAQYLHLKFWFCEMAWEQLAKSFPAGRGMPPRYSVHGSPGGLPPCNRHAQGSHYMGRKMKARDKTNTTLG